MADQEWAKEQLASVGLSYSSEGDDLLVYQTVLQLLSVYYQQNHTENTSSRTVELFAELAKGHVVAPDDTPEQWVPLSLGMFRKGDRVRVRRDAFDDDRAVAHNGREGVIVDARRGDVIVDIRDDRVPVIVGHHYRPNELEGLMK
jgi:hypothetical protein